MNKRKIIIISSILAVLLIAIILIAVYMPRGMQILTTDGDEEFSVVRRGGGGGGGGGDIASDPDEECPECDAVWVADGPKILLGELDVSSKDITKVSTEGFLDESNKRQIVKISDLPTGHWECRGPCPEGKVCRVWLPSITVKPECRCQDEYTCHLEYGDLFCDRAVPAKYLKDFIQGNELQLTNYLGELYGTENIGQFTDYINNFCGIMKCEGTCPRNEKCVFEWTEVEPGVPMITDCECQDWCHKELNIFKLDKNIFVKEVTNVKIGEAINLGDWIDVKVIDPDRQFPEKQINYWHCEGPCPLNQICDQNPTMTDCECRDREEGDEPEPTEQIDCEDIKPSGDSEWWKCLAGHCDNTPQCLSDGWYFGGSLVKAGNCIGCAAYCDNIGTRSQGWYDSCDMKLISWDSKCHLVSTCFYDTWSNKCVCTGYTDECAWHMDYNNYPGPISENNIPYRYCDGLCLEIIEPDQIVTRGDVEICIQTTIMDVGQVCDCVTPEEEDIDDDGIPDIEEFCYTTSEKDTYEWLRTKGYCEDNYGIHWNRCDGNFVVSWSCTEDNVCYDNRKTSCSFVGNDYYCSDGRCITGKEPTIAPVRIIPTTTFRKLSSPVGKFFDWIIWWD